MFSGRPSSPYLSVPLVSFPHLVSPVSWIRVWIRVASAFPPLWLYHWINSPQRFIAPLKSDRCDPLIPTPGIFFIWFFFISGLAALKKALAAHSYCSSAFEVALRTASDHKAKASRIVALLNRFFYDPIARAKKGWHFLSGLKINKC